MRKERTIIVVISALVITTIAVNHLLSVGDRFSSELWNENSESRASMTTDLEHSRLLIGKSAEEVESLLGKPSSVEKLTSTNGQLRNAWWYQVEKGGSEPLNQFFVVELKADTVTLAYKRFGTDAKRYAESRINPSR